MKPTTKKPVAKKPVAKKPVAKKPVAKKQDPYPHIVACAEVLKRAVEGAGGVLVLSYGLDDGRTVRGQTVLRGYEKRGELFVRAVENTAKAVEQVIQ